jgi:cell wall-associated NlpC family hydrolase
MKHTLNIVCWFKLQSLFFLFVAVAAFLIVGCAAAPRPAGETPPVATASQITRGHAVDAEIEQRLRQEYRHWRGTRHRLGGSGRGGIDCSGFVQAVYNDVFKIELPRSTRLQVRTGQAVSYKDLRAGDLVFFRPPSYPRHVGIYLGRGEFVHASKKNGVTVSRIDQTYWGKYYWTARRILSSSHHP